MKPMKIDRRFYEKVIAHINRKDWWHVPPQHPEAYSKRGKFYASTYREAEFYGRPNDNPEKVRVERPLVGDEQAISKVLRIPPQHADMTLEEIAEHDARWRNAALAKGYDSIVLMAPKAFAEFKRSGKLPRSLELNILNVSVNGEGQAEARNPQMKDKATKSHISWRRRENDRTRTLRLHPEGSRPAQG